jgi:hypothetical protein
VVSDARNGGGTAHHHRRENLHYRSNHVARLL